MDFFPASAFFLVRRFIESLLNFGIGCEPERNTTFTCMFSSWFYIEVDPNDLKILQIFKKNSIFKKIRDKVCFFCVL